MQKPKQRLFPGHQGRIYARSIRHATLGGMLPFVLLVSCSESPAGRGAPPTSAQTTGGELRVQRLAIVDAAGKVCAEVGPDENGGTQLFFFGKDAEVVASFGTDQAGEPTLRIGHAGEKVLCQLSAMEPHGPALIMRDRTGQRRAGIIITKAGKASLALFDQAGRERLSMAVDKNGFATVSLKDDARTPRAALWLDENGMSALDLSVKGRTRILLGLDAAGRAAISLLDEAEQPVWSQTVP